jgi:hypothetical protein
MRPVVNLLRVSGLDIRSQLALEESLLRATQQNWVVVNNGAFRPAIVMGISGYVCVQNRHLLCHAACIYTTLYGPRKFHLHVRVLHVRLCMCASACARSQARGGAHSRPTSKASAHAGPKALHGGRDCGGGQQHRFRIPDFQCELR